MALSSMTGFARAEGTFGAWRWAWELRSVNARGLDLRLRVPAGFEDIDAAARAEAAKALARGSISGGLTLKRDERVGAYRINTALLDRLAEAAAAYAGRPGLAPARVDGLLAVKGVVEPVEAGSDEVEEERAPLVAALLAGFGAALAELGRARTQEGARLAAVVRAQVDRIEALTLAAEAVPGRDPEAVAARLAAQVRALVTTGELDVQRLHQEAVLLATRADVREELDRLLAHVAQARGLLAAGGPAGRRLDFLAQEFNREANTLCSKSNDAELTRIGLELKTVVDQLREQVQNVE